MNPYESERMISHYGLYGMNYNYRGWRSGQSLFSKRSKVDAKARQAKKEKARRKRSIEKANKKQARKRNRK